MRITKVTGFLLAAFFALATLGAGSPARAQENHQKLTSKEVRSLIANAKTPADHQKLAAYYRQMAAEANASAAEHEQMLAAYHQNPGSHPLAKASGGPSAHCSTLIRLYKDEAAQYLDLAAQHEAMAKAAAKHE